MVKLNLTGDEPERDRELWQQFVRAVDVAVDDGVTQDSGILVSMAYAELPDRAAKGRARSYIAEAVSVALSGGQHAKAEALNKVSEAMKIKNGISLRTAQRYQRYLEDVEALQIAFGMLVLNPPPDVVPLLKDGWLDNLQTENTAALLYREYLLAADGSAKEPEASDVEKRAARISLGKAPAGSGRKPTPKG